MAHSARKSEKTGNATLQRKPSKKSFGKIFGDIANDIARETGRAHTFMIAVAMILVWAATGPIFHYSDTWQLVINTGTTIVTFLMVFLIQNSQNRDSAAMQVKLDELIRVGLVHNKFVGIEHLTEDELQDIREKCERRANKENGSSNARADRKAEKAADKAGE